MKMEFDEDKLQRFLDNAEEFGVDDDGYLTNVDGVISGVFKLYDGKSEFILNFIKMDHRGYSGFMAIKNNKVIEAQDVPDHGPYFAVRVAELPSTEDERHEIAVNHGFFSDRDNFIGGGKNWRREE